MENDEGAIRKSFKAPPARIDLSNMRFDVKDVVYRAVTMGTLLLLWHFMALHYNSQLVLPTPWETFKAFFSALQDEDTLFNLGLTLWRVMIGLCIAMLIGLFFGFAMGYSHLIYKLVDPIIGPLRQVPIMAWVPLAIVWFGLGDGPTLFLIAMVATFPILLNTMAGVQAVPQNYYHAARSMGAGRLSIFTRITVPGALPDVITGLRLGLSAGWMSVI